MTSLEKSCNALDMQQDHIGIICGLAANWLHAVAATVVFAKTKDSASNITLLLAVHRVVLVPPLQRMHAAGLA